MVIKVLFKGFNFSQDGPGNRLVYHLQGCNMRCPWCSTPESMAEQGCMIAKGKLQDNICPFGAVHNDTVNREFCKSCAEKLCSSIPGSKLKLSCGEYELEDILEEIKNSSPMFFDGGGVTFTGGEPTLQFDALKELLTRIRDLGINTALETNGSHVKLPELYDLIDYLIIDCKHYDSITHEKATGIGNKIILNNIALAAKFRSQLLVRIPLIKGFNSSVKDAECFAELFKSMNPNVCVFELLRYHEYGKDKWAQCGMAYNMKNAKVSQEEFDLFKKVFDTRNLQTIRT